MPNAGSPSTNAPDGERATFADALARKRRRFAFPDGFNAGLRRFRDRIKRVEGKVTPDGGLLVALDEIRVQASPNWDAAKVTVFFWFLLEREKISDFDAAHRIVQGWMSAKIAKGAVGKRLTYQRTRQQPEAEA